MKGGALNRKKIGCCRSSDVHFVFACNSRNAFSDHHSRSHLQAMYMSPCSRELNPGSPYELHVEAVRLTGVVSLLNCAAIFHVVSRKGVRCTFRFSIMRFPIPPKSSYDVGLGFICTNCKQL